ncbi:unnamed protein product [Fraxinus pennsylvanica]|uniref:Fatty acyl-CoA reductase n=1 Tax=Fraxinus pennsylvanica TaxID=56036 RepID=A0AAD2E1F5_9LAMI|nr:unnamed protein product [Fraxinus pennsylvanica]
MSSIFKIVLTNSVAKVIDLTLCVPIPQLLHDFSDLSLPHIDPCIDLTLCVSIPQLSHNGNRSQTCILIHCIWNNLKSSANALYPSIPCSTLDHAPNCLESSISGAPPPAIRNLLFTKHLTTQCIMQTSLGLIKNHLVRSTDENTSSSPHILNPSDLDNLSTIHKRHLLYQICIPQLFSTEMLNVISKDLFGVLKEERGANLTSFISEKITIVPGDITCETLGINDLNLSLEISTEVDVVINLAATTNFDERYDVALGINTLGPLHVLNFAKTCGKLKVLLHVSTAYVCGEKEGVILEKPFNLGDTLNGTSGLDINAEKQVIEEKLKELNDENVSAKSITSAMKDLGIQRIMSALRDNEAYEEELLDYEEEDEQDPNSSNGRATGGYVRLHSSGFRDFLLKPELLQAIVELGFEHPSEGKAILLIFP